MASRPQVSIFSTETAQATSQVPLPAVLIAPIRSDVVDFVHTNMAKNNRQAYGVSWKRVEAGMQHSAHSWGTGRAVSRIPRVSGGGTHAAGAGAYGNMCRGGRMYAPTRTWRRWHRKINVNQKRVAVASALAATAVAPLVQARGHRISDVPEMPLVVSNEVESLTKTAKAVALLKKFGAYADVEKVKNTKKTRKGLGKLRNRPTTSRKGPLVVYASDNGIVKAFRNLPGVEVASVDSLNLLQLAPGGHLGRFIVWSQAAFEKLDAIYGTYRKAPKFKKGFQLPRPIMTNLDLNRLINSDEVQSVVNPAKVQVRPSVRHKNPLKNLGVMLKLNPYAKTLRRREILNQRAGKAAKSKAQKQARYQRQKAGRATFKAMNA